MSQEAHDSAASTQQVAGGPPGGARSPHDEAQRGFDSALNSVFESLPVGIVEFDQDGNIRYASSAARCLFPEAGSLSAALAGVVADRPTFNWTEWVREVFVSDRPQRMEAVLLRPAGQPERFVDLICSTLSEPGGHGCLRGLMLIEDVTARLSMEQRLAVSERLAAVGKLCASVAHELNNPLDGLLRYINLALRIGENSGHAKLIEYLRCARDATLRMVRVVRELLEFSRNSPSASGGQAVDRLVEEAVGAMRPGAARQNVSIVCHFQDAETPPTYGSNLFQVFCNLIKNAVDAMPNGGTLTISARVESHEVVVRFQDSGCGLPADASRLFEPFFTTKPLGQGTGLGLAVSREIVEKYGGSVTATDRTDGPGAVFTVRLPLEPVFETGRGSPIASRRGAAKPRPGSRAVAGPNAQRPERNRS